MAVLTNDSTDGQVDPLLHAQERIQYPFFTEEGRDHEEELDCRRGKLMEVTGVGAGCGGRRPSAASLRCANEHAHQLFYKMPLRDELTSSKKR